MACIARTLRALRFFFFNAIANSEASLSLRKEFRKGRHLLNEQSTLRALREHGVHCVLCFMFLLTARRLIKKLDSLYFFKVDRLP